MNGIFTEHSNIKTHISHSKRSITKMVSDDQKKIGWEKRLGSDACTRSLCFNAILQHILIDYTIHLFKKKTF